MKWKENDLINGFRLIEKIDKKGYWLAEHKCGRIYSFRNSQIKTQNYCKGCIDKYNESNFGSNHKSWKGIGELSSDLFTTIKLNARDRNLEFNLDIDFLWNLFIEQDKKCKLSGIEIYLNGKCDDKKYKTATLDRIDSKIGYIKGNVQWLHRDINKLKNNFPEDYLIKLCGKIYLNSESINDNINIENGIFYKNGKFLKKI